MIDAAAKDGPKYRAPALQKGLEIIELLAASPTPLTTSEISLALARSVSEIFRMLQELEERGYIARRDERYRLTNRLFLLSMTRPPIKDLLSLALPTMHRLAGLTDQSCHLAIASGAEMVVVAAVEAPGLLGFAVRIGYRRPLHRSASGRVLLAFQDNDVRAGMIEAIAATGDTVDQADLDAVLVPLRADGRYYSKSSQITGITDLSCPVLVDGAARAALTIPYADGPAAKMTAEAVLAAVHDAAAAIGAALSPTA